MSNLASPSPSRKLAVMQPYFLPYLGYFQLIAHADVFVIYDDVQFLKQGWVNRNQISLNGKPHMITVPVARERLSGPICHVMISMHPGSWRKKILRTVSSAYSKAPSFGTVYPMLERWLPESEETISQINISSIKEICRYLNIDTEIKISSHEYGNRNLTGVDRVIDICKIEKASTYINSPGGRSLYTAEMFDRHSIELQFVRPHLPPYRQGGDSFVAGLSILDVLMNNTCQEARELLAGSSLEA